MFFSCDVLSFSTTSLTEGKLDEDSRSEPRTGKVVFSLETKPGILENTFDLELVIIEQGDSVSNARFFPYNSQYMEDSILSDGLIGGNRIGHFLISDDYLLFVNRWGSHLSLKRYYKSDYHGVLHYVTLLNSFFTYGLDCQSNTVDLDYLRDLYNSLPQN